MAKVKIKTRKSAVKRFHETASGILMHRHTGRQKKMISKSHGRRRRLYSESGLYPGKEKSVQQQLPYGSNY